MMIIFYGLAARGGFNGNLILCSYARIAIVMVEVIVLSIDVMVSVLILITYFDSLIHVRIY
jgi:hypothetical protein